MSLRKIYIRFKGDHPDSPNTFAAFDGFNQMGAETAPFYGFGDIDTLDDLGPEVGVVGFVCDAQSALNKLDKPMPAPLDYPEELRAWLMREVQLMALSDVKRAGVPRFIKPIEHKVFNGFVWRGANREAVRLAPLEDDARVWASDVVEFVSEYRCFVLDGEVLGVKHYKGDWSVALDRGMVDGAVRAYHSAPAAYALDFGVLASGETALVEANDAFALGHYGLQSVLYARMIEARWQELTKPSGEVGAQKETAGSLSRTGGGG